MTTADYPFNILPREKNTLTVSVRVLVIPLVSKIRNYGGFVLSLVVPMGIEPMIPP